MLRLLLLLGLATAAMAQSSLPALRKLDDIPYVPNGHERQRLDLYYPEQAAGPKPVLILVHGGGWQNGRKGINPRQWARYFEKGYAVASLGYRLTDAAIFPAQIEDCRAAVRWLRAHAAEYGLDVNRFGAFGSSAGGHLVALLGTAGDEKAFDVGENLDQSARVQAVCDYFGPSDFIAFVNTPGYQAHARPGSAEVKLMGGPLPEKRELAQRASPVSWVTADDPPFLIVHGDKDPIVPIQQSTLLTVAMLSTCRKPPLPCWNWRLFAPVRPPFFTRCHVD